MMELAHSLLLNEEALSRISESKRPVFIFEWLRFLDKVLVAAQKSDIKESQQKLINQLTNQISENPGPPTRKLLARCLATIFSVGDTFTLFETINKCNDIIKNKDDSPSYLPTRLAAVACIGGMYERLGRMVGRSYEETIQILIKALKNAESQGRCEIMLTLQKVVAGLGSAGANCYKDIYKATRTCLTDRAMTVRAAAAKCMYELVCEAPFTYVSELDTITSTCYRALDGANYDARCDIAKLLGHLLASTQQPKASQLYKGKNPPKLEDVLSLLTNGFFKGGTGFLKSTSAGEMIKGGSTINREVRVGITHAYVEFGKAMGSVWLERNLQEFLAHTFGLAANPKAAPSHVDAVYARKCVLFILHALIGGILGDKSQITAAKEICQVIIKQMTLVDAVGDGERSAAELNLSQHVLVCALQELGNLVQGLGTSASPLVSEPSTGIIEPVVSVLLHPSPSARLAAAWCLRSIAVALPSQMTILIERCMNRMHHLKSSPEAVTGYSYALAALLGGVKDTALGIPHAKGKQIFRIAEELLRTAVQTSRLSLQRTQSGWILLGALMTLGPPVVKSHLPRMLLMWRNAFPRSAKELEAEKARGDNFTWQLTLEARAGALGAMYSFVLHCPELVTEDVTRRLLPPLECALTMNAHMPAVVKMFGAHLKASAAMVRLRLYDVLSLLPPKTYEGAYTALLRELVAEFTLTDNPANTTTSLLRSMCHQDDSVILGSWLQETDHKAIEDQLQPNSASGSGALEHDPASIFLKPLQGDGAPGPLPLGVAVIDSSVHLYGLVFPHVAHKHRLQMLDHFSECIRQAKSSRQQAMQINIFTAVLSALKALADTKTGFGNLDVRKAAISLVLGALGSSNPILRCAAGEALGRMAQVVGDGKFIAEMAQYSFDKLKVARDVVTRTGHSLALGCLHRYVGGLGSGHHLNTSVSILLALAQDCTSPIVQVWALHALALIADSGGPMFRSYVEPSLSLVLQLLLSVPPSSVDVHQCLGKCLAALITTIGPELQGNSGSIVTARLSCLVCCAVMQDHHDSMVQAEAISCLQQLHLFAPRHVNLTTLVPHLCETLSSPHLLLRRAAVSCLRQLSTREAREVSEHAVSLATEPRDPKDKYSYVIKDKDKPKAAITETGLEGALFSMLDKERDKKMISDVQDTLVSLLQALAADNLTRWLTLIKDVLQASSELSTLNSPVEDADAVEKDDDEAGLHISASGSDESRPAVAPRWPTRVFAIDCLLKIIAVCDSSANVDVHFDLVMARVAKEQGKGDYLVLHLSELVRMAFIAATSDSDKLRLVGLAALQEIVSKFAKTPEPEFPGHVILEQYQAQVGAALRPAFSPETAPDVTAEACEVCSCWIGSGVARDLNDLRRVHQLLVSSLAKLKDGKDSSPLYSESASTMERLSVLRAWAEVYIVAMQQESERRQKLANHQNEEEEEEDLEYGGGESLLSLVQPEMKTLSRHWLAALKDYALISLPQEYSSQLPAEGGAFYTIDTIESSRPHYKRTWPPILYAASLWLKETGFISADKHNNRPANMQADPSDTDRFHLLLGICVEALCSPTSIQPLGTVNQCLKAIYCLLDDPWPREKLGSEQTLAIELLNVLHRLLLTRDSAECFLLVMRVVSQVVKAAQENLQMEREKQAIPDEPSEGNVPANAPLTPLGDGGATGDIVPGKSLVFATMEVCLCVMVRHLPSINPNMSTTGLGTPLRHGTLSDDTCQLISSALQALTELPQLCSPAGSVSVLPTILFLVIGVIKEMAAKDTRIITSCVPVALTCLKQLCTSKFLNIDSCREQWIQLLQSALATVIDYSKEDAEKDQAGIDDVTLLLTLSVFFVSCPPEVVHAKNLLEPCVDVFSSGWSSNNPTLQLRCVQSLTSVFQHSHHTVWLPFLHSVVPYILEYLLNVYKTGLTSELDFAIVLDGVKMTEQLVVLADGATKVHLLTLLVPMLVSYLKDDTKDSEEFGKFANKLHDYALQHLMKIGPLYPADFRTVMQSCPDLKLRLEQAVKINQQKQATNNAGSGEMDKQAATQPAQPSIKLKMDFSNFSKKS